MECKVNFAAYVRIIMPVTLRQPLIKKCVYAAYLSFIIIFNEIFNQNNVDNISFMIYI